MAHLLMKVKYPSLFFTRNIICDIPDTFLTEYQINYINYVKSMPDFVNYISCDLSSDLI